MTLASEITPMTTIEIKKGVPIPDTESPVRTALRKMEIGDYFDLPTDERNKGALNATAKRVGVAITTRKIEDGIRVWRTA